MASGDDAAREVTIVMAHIMAFDQGTTSSRVIIFDDAGWIVSVAQREFEQIYPRPGWVEHDANEIWQSEHDVALEALERAGLGWDAIAGVGITNQRETVVVWDRSTGEPICNAIVWQDRRTAGVCDALVEAGHGELIRSKTGLVVDAYFSGTKIAWILEHVEGARARSERGELAFGTIDSWLAYKLSGGELHITDVSNASRTMLFNIHECAWDGALCELLGVPMSMLPRVCSSSEVYGDMAAFGGRGVPLAGIVGDQQAATMGQVCVEPGMAKNTYGTGCFLLMNTGVSPHDSANRLLTTVAWGRGGETTYALEGGVFVGGAAVQWLRDGLKIIESAPDVERLATSVSDSGGVVLVPCLAGMGAPHWDPYARGAILGISRGTTDAHIARATLEGIAFQVADLVGVMEKDAGGAMTELRVDGGAAANDFMMQFQADILGIPVVRPTVLETTALGAAYMAGLAVGVWPDVGSIAAHWNEERRFEPGMGRDQAAELRRRWDEGVRRAMGWVQEGAS